MSNEIPTTTSPMIYTLMSRVMADVGAVGKNQTNQHFKFKFRGIDDMQNAVQPALVKNGVCMTSEVLDERRESVDGKDKFGNAKRTHTVVLRMRFSWYAPDGSSVATTTCGEGMDEQDKATNKAMSAAFKYALLHTFCVPTEDQADSDASGPVDGHRKAQEPAQSPAERIAALIREIDACTTEGDLSAFRKRNANAPEEIRVGVRARYEQKLAELTFKADEQSAVATTAEVARGFIERIAEIKAIPEANNWRKKHLSEVKEMPDIFRDGVLRALEQRVQELAGGAK